MNDCLAVSVGAVWSPQLANAVQAVGTGRSSDPADRAQLRDSLLAVARLWQIDPAEILPVLRVQTALLQRTYREWSAFDVAGEWADRLALLWLLWIPLAMRLDRAQRQSDQLWIQGVLGGQGAGKTTLTAIIATLLNWLGQRAVCLSIDDLYLTYAERQQRQQQDPRLKWRGPPGTHDISLGLSTFGALRQAQPTSEIELPQFDKSLEAGRGDRTQPLRVMAPSVVLFEGWLVGARPLDPFPKDHLPWPINSDAQRQFARDCNRRLSDYLPLWDELDSLMLLVPEDYRWSLDWRTQAERDRIAQGGQGLSDSEIAAFVTYFWRALHPQLYIEPLMTDANTWLTVVLDAAHRPIRLSVNVHS